MSHVWCFEQIETSVKVPERYALTPVGALSLAAKDHNDKQTVADTVSPQFLGEADLITRISAKHFNYEGYPVSYAAENLSSGLNSAFDIVSAWMW
ncbi:hypothetical protein GPECTOR_5g238 [Gonium pectorale]|uniref:Uncharacterized protein n=1 Tax=Gonium pectorale TaxID=33097 RepID=A0A150GWT5_GONPE|nr:hypothetical protein GPECTOR_5g238 [Gonium pectorale]|eukprot:KXZ54138.1 hypothetical protein GPECTOR_5g238 [Gonium pectorale]